MWRMLSNQPEFFQVLHISEQYDCIAEYGESRGIMVVGCIMHYIAKRIHHLSCVCTAQDYHKLWLKCRCMIQASDLLQVRKFTCRWQHSLLIPKLVTPCRRCRMYWWVVIFQKYSLMWNCKRSVSVAQIRIASTAHAKKTALNPAQKRYMIESLAHQAREWVWNLK